MSANPLMQFNEERRRTTEEIAERALALATALHAAMPASWHKFRALKWSEPKYLLRDIERLFKEELPVELRFSSDISMQACGFFRIDDAERQLSALNKAWAGQLRLVTQRLCAPPHWGFQLYLVQE